MKCAIRLPLALKQLRWIEGAYEAVGVFGDGKILMTQQENYEGCRATLVNGPTTVD